MNSKFSNTHKSKQVFNGLPVFSSLHEQKIARLLQQGMMLINAGQLDKAEKVSLEVLNLNPNQSDALNFLGIIAAQSGQFNRAADFLIKASKTKTSDFFLFNNIGNVLRELKRFDESHFFLKKAIKINPNFANAHYSLGLLMIALDRLNDALKCFDEALKFKSDFSEAHINRGIVLDLLKRSDEALISLDKAVQFKRDSAEAYYNRGKVLNQLKRFDEALANYDKAIELKVEYTEAYINRGSVLLEFLRFNEALASFEKAIELKPDFADAYYNRGNLLQELQQSKDSLFNYDKAVLINLNFAEAHYNRGILLQSLKRYSEALSSFEKVIELDPDHEDLLGMHLHTKMLVCDWKNFEINVNDLLIQINKGKKSSPIFPILALTDSLPINRKIAEISANNKHPYNPSLGIIEKHKHNKRIKIGYYSADFREHPVSYLAAELFEKHDKDRFELLGFYFGPTDSSEMHKRISSSFVKFNNVRSSKDSSIAQLSRDLGVDIAVDLTGMTANARPGIFSHRAAPIQLSYIGFLGTIGASYYDYLIADKTIIPANSQQYYVEKICYLPSYQVNDSKRKISDKIFTREELNLPKHTFVFCCFNNTYKITPSTFDSWMRILSSVPDSVLFLFSGNELATANLKFEAQKRGVSSARLIFGSSLERSEYLARYRVADLFLDTFPYNAGTTASDALWAGLPVLTCTGESFASRVAASLLQAIELPELITDTRTNYEAIAIELATNPTKLKAIKDKLERNRLTTRLFDTTSFTKQLEDAYEQMYQRYQVDLPPNHIYINS